MKTLEEYMYMRYRMEIIPDNEQGGYAACYPELRGCVASGDSLERVISNLKAAKQAWIEKAMADGIEIPEPEDYRM